MRKPALVVIFVKRTRADSKPECDLAGRRGVRTHPKPHAVRQRSVLNTWVPEKEMVRLVGRIGVRRERREKRETQQQTYAMFQQRVALDGWSPALDFHRPTTTVERDANAGSSRHTRLLFLDPCARATSDACGNLTAREKRVQIAPPQPDGRTRGPMR